MIIKNGILHVGDGQVLQGYDILIEDNIIKKIDKTIENKQSETIDASGCHVFPGFIDPVTSYGTIDTHRITDTDEISNPISPDAKIKYAFNHNEIMDEEIYKVGITSVGAAPGNRNIIGGQMAVFKTWGKNSKKMLVKEAVGMKGSVIKAVKDTYGERKVSPMTRMGIFSELEDFFRENQNELENKWDMPFFINANRSAEIYTLLNIMGKYNKKLVICGAFQADRCLDAIKETKASIVVGDLSEYTAANYNNTDIYKIAKLMESGIPISFTLSSDYGPKGKIKYLWNAIDFYRSGVKSEDVVKMMTLNPAKILGVDDRLGSLEEKKEADIVIYSNNPVEYYKSNVICTIVGGKIAYQTRRDF